MILVNVAVLSSWLYLCARIVLINTGRVIAKRVGALLLLWLPLTVIGGNMFLKESGVCISQMRRFTDDELIEMAVRSLARGGGSTIENTEQSVQKFLRENPRCCEVSWADNTPFEIFLGLVTKEVRVHYEQNILGLSDRYNGESFVMNACGNTLDRTDGFSGNTPTTTNHVYQPKGVKQ